MQLLELSKLVESDRQSVFDLLQDPISMKYIGPRCPLTNNEAEEWFQTEIHSPSRYVFRCAMTKELIGFCGIKEIDGVSDFGYFLRKKYSGKGYGKKMCQMAIKKLEHLTDFSKVKVFIASGNVASERVALSLGWLKVCQTKHDDEVGYLYVITTD